MQVKRVRLKVQEALPRDIGKARARLPMTAMMKIGVKPGDFLELKGREVAAATAWPSDDDSGNSLVRIDGSIRRNLGVTLNEFVDVSKAVVRAATSVVLAPLGKSVQLDEDFESFVRNRIKGMPLVEGSSLSIVVLGNPVSFKVVRVSPRGIVVAEDSTKLRVETKLARVADGGAADHLRRYRRSQGAASEAARNRRAPTAVPRALREAGHRAPQGRTPLRAPPAAARPYSQRPSPPNLRPTS